MKVAIVYDRVNKWGGAERVLLALQRMYPDAPLYTSVYLKEKARWADAFPRVVPSYLNNLRALRGRHEYLAPFMPSAFESFDFTGFDLVISVSSEAAKGIILPPDTLHVCYCLTPTRYLWSGEKDYFDSQIKRKLYKAMISYLRRWDVVAASRPDVIVAISTEVCERIKKYYHRESEVVFPPVEVQRKGEIENKGKYYLLVSRLVKYKKVDMAISAFNKLGRKLVVVGTGSEEAKLRRMAGENIVFRGFVEDRELWECYAQARALVMPQFEDFGIVSVESQAFGVPVIAYGRGGVIDTVIHGETGVLFGEQSVEALIVAVREFETMKFDKMKIMRNSEKFGESPFREQFEKVVNKYI